MLAQTGVVLGAIGQTILKNIVFVFISTEAQPAVDYYINAFETFVTYSRVSGTQVVRILVMFTYETFAKRAEKYS